MEMTITVHVPRRRPRPVDVVVRWSGTYTATDLAAALGDHLNEPVPFLTAGGGTVDVNTLVGMPPLVHGASVAVGRGAPCAESLPSPGTVLDLAVVGGPDSGRSCPLTPPSLHIGRSVPDGLVVADEALSRYHARVDVGSSGIVVEDVGSTNGVVVDGRVLRGPTAIDGSSTIVLGSSTLRVRRGGGAGLPLHPFGDGRLAVRPPAAPVRPLGPVEVESPTAPLEPQRARIPWLGALVPVPIALALAVVLGPQLLLFALLGPVALVANAVADRWGAGRAHRRATAAHAGALREAQERLRRALQDEVARLDADHPDPHAVLGIAEGRLPGLWQGGELDVRLGLGDVATPVAWLDGSRKEHPLASGAPVVIDLTDVGCLGVVGPPTVTDRLLANIVGQLCTRHPPDRLMVAVVATTPSWEWTRRMPHAVADWSGDVSGAPGPPPPVRLVVVPSATTESVASVEPAIRVEEAVMVTAATTAGALPTGCTAVLEATRDGRHALSRGADRTVLTPDGVGLWWCDRVSRALAPLRSVRQPHPAGLPSSATLGEVLGEPRVTATSVLARWAQATEEGQGASAPVAAVGFRADGLHRIDLRQDGPHILVGGTTGSGKSEFLRTLVTSLALGSPPADLAFVLVDFKGGAAFGPCADLPHVVGMVTDLDNHLVARALTSLGAELRRRERIFAAAAVSDLDAYLRCRGPGDEPVPRLVVVVDELRALVDEVPEFVSGMVRLAALGRSLGVHLVLATQRPSGVVTPEIQANVNLRVAFRVRDRADSLDILDDGSAADLSSDSPGRALARGGDGALVAFQAAIVAPDRGSGGPYLSVAAAGGSPTVAGRRHIASHTGQPSWRVAVDERLAEISAVVSAVAEAQRRTGGPLPRPPWLAPLPPRVDLVTQRHGAAVVGGVAVGVVDEPELQRITPLLWGPTAGGWLLVGRPGSGRTTAARAVALAAALASDADRLHIHVLDTGGSLADLAALPHVGTHVRADDTRAVTSLVSHLRAECDRRRRSPDPGDHVAVGPPPARILVMVDGWEQLVEAQPDAGLGGPADDLPRLLRDGGAVGITGVVTGGRSLLQPRWSGLGASTFLLGTVDPLDAVLAGLRSTDLPTSPPPGRAVRIADRRSVQFAAATAGLSARIAATSGPATGGRGPVVLRPLPSVVRWSDAVSRPQAPRGDRPSHQAGTGQLRLALGVAGSSAATWAWAPDRMGRRLLVAGPARSGRTNALRVIEASALAAGLQVAVVSARPRPRQEPHTGSAILGPQDLDALVALRRDHPALVLLVDDADLLDDAPVVAAVREISALVDRDGGLVALTTSSAALLGRFRGLDVDLARHRTGLLLRPRPGDGEVFGLRHVDVIPSLPGRGLACVPHEVSEVQVFLAEPATSPGHPLSGRGVRPGGDGVRVAGTQSGKGRADGDDDHRPPDECTVPLDQSDADGHQEHIPDDRRGPGPGRPTHPPESDECQGNSAEQDEESRHEDPRRIAPLTDRQLVDVVRGEPHEGERLESDEHGGGSSGPT